MQHHDMELPHTGDRMFITDGGLETSLIFKQGIDLPAFAAFGLLETPEGCTTLRDYYRPYLEIARFAGCGFILESPTWRANPDWGMELGYSREQLMTMNRDAITLMHSIREKDGGMDAPVLVSGCVGPRGDGYVAGEQMTSEQAQAYHCEQVTAFAESGADMVSAMTMTYPEEAIGVVRACQQSGLPVAISFTTETDGRLPNGMTLGESIERVDQATDCGPAYYMINCAHPDHFSQALSEDAGWAQRVRGIRANASRMSHEQLDNSEQLDDGNPAELGQQIASLRKRFPAFNVLGGCCGTDERHIEQLCHSCA